MRRTPLQPTPEPAVTERLARVERRLRRSERLAAALGIVLAGIVSLAAFRGHDPKPHFPEIDAERINIVEKDGRVRMVIANRERSPGPIYKGKSFGYPGGTRAGMIFYNDEGTEDGGLIFQGKTENGRYTAYGHLSFDQYGQDQVINLEYDGESGKQRQGLQIADRPDISILDVISRRDSIQRMPDGSAKAAALAKLNADQGGVPYGAPRLYVGRDTSKAAVVDLKDRFGRSRLRLEVDSLGAARIEFLDDSGRVTRRIPE